MIDSLETIHFFKKLATIPRESGNEAKVSEYLCEFAKERNLFFERDQYNNVLIKKQTIDKEPIILQAHTDMVCEKEPDKEFDFKTDSIQLVEEDGKLYANGTTLGADNGIGVAQILAILDSDIPCNIEALFTVSEETSMIGAMNFDTSKLKGKKLLNLDGFEENTILIESACFYDIILKLQDSFNKPLNKNKYEITLSGLLGGHSGFDIDKNRGNSSIELAKLLDALDDIEISDFVGGTKFNVIPSQARAQFYTDLPYETVKEICKKMLEELQQEHSEMNIALNRIDENSTDSVLSSQHSKEFLQKVVLFPNGVMNVNDNNEVTTSVNLGVVDLKGKEFKVGFRSSKEVEEKECLEKIREFSKQHDLEFTTLGFQPGFESNPNSSLITDLLKAHPIEEFKKKPDLKSVHITVEVGFFKEKIPELEIAIISPNIQGAHTIKECVELASVERANKWLTNFLINQYKSEFVIN